MHLAVRLLRSGSVARAPYPPLDGAAEDHEPPLDGAADAHDSPLNGAARAEDPRPRWIRPEWRRRLAIDSGFALFAALTYFNVSTFGFHVIVSRLLGPARYGALGAVLVLTSLAGNATGAVSTAVTRTVAVRRDGAEWDVARAQRRGLIAAFAAFVIVAALAAPLESYLHLGSPVPVLLLAVMAAAILAGLVPRGVLMGERRFARVATALTTGVTLKLVAGAMLASSLGVSGAVAAAALGEALTTLLYIRALGRRRGSTPLRVPLRSSSLATGAYGGFWLLAAADTFFARHLLTATGSGLYVAASTAGSIALFLPNNITLTAFPSLAWAAGDGNSPPGTFTRAFIAASTLTVAAAGVLALLPSLAIAVLFGSSFRSASEILVLLAVSNGAQGMVSFLLHHQLAHHRLTCLLPWAGLGTLAIVANAAHHSPRQIATEAMSVSLVLMLAMGAASLRMVVARRPADPGPDPMLPLPVGFVTE